jgi:hypothetical protein
LIDVGMTYICKSGKTLGPTGIQTLNLQVARQAHYLTAKGNFTTNAGFYMYL